MDDLRLEADAGQGSGAYCGFATLIRLPSVGVVRFAPQRNFEKLYIQPSSFIAHGAFQTFVIRWTLSSSFMVNK